VKAQDVLLKDDVCLGGDTARREIVDAIFHRDGRTTHEDTLNDLGSRFLRWLSGVFAKAKQPKTLYSEASGMAP
jgi:hypothetical protein